MRTIVVVVVSILVGAGAAGATLSLYSEARVAALVRENEVLKQKAEAVQEKLAVARLSGRRALLLENQVREFVNPFVEKAKATGWTCPPLTHEE